MIFALIDFQISLNEIKGFVAFLHIGLGQIQDSDCRGTMTVMLITKLQSHFMERKPNCNVLNTCFVVYINVVTFRPHRIFSRTYKQKAKKEVRLRRFNKEVCLNT